MEQKNFFSLLLQFKAPVASIILMMLGTGFFLTYLSIFLHQEGYTSDQIGHIHSAYYLGMLIGGFTMDKIIRKLNHIQALTVFGCLGTGTIILQALIPSYTVWILLRLLNGISIAALYIVIESWMLHFSSLKSRGIALSLYMISLYSAQAASQQFIPYINLDSTTPFLLTALFMALSIIPIGLTTQKFELPPENPLSPLSLRKLFQASPFGVSGCLVGGLILSSIYSFFPLLAEDMDLSSENIMSTTIAGGVFLQWPLGKLSDLFDRRKTYLSLVIGAALIITGTYFLHFYSLSITYLLFFLIGGLTFTLYPLSITQVCDRVDSSLITAATGLLLLYYGVGAIIGPVIASYASTHFGVKAILLLFSMLLSALAAVGLISMLRRPSVPLNEQLEFVPNSSRTRFGYQMEPYPPLQTTLKSVENVLDDVGLKNESIEGV